MKTPTLEDFRAKIDVIDNKILQLLKERVAVVKDVAKYKQENRYQFFIRYAREADMIKNLQKTYNFGISKSAIFSIWRKIIASSNALEQKLEIAIHNPCNIPDYRYLVEQYYGDFITTTENKSAKNIISAINNRQVEIGVFSNVRDKRNHKSWWMLLIHNQNQIKVFAMIPPIKSTAKATSYNQNNLYLVANKDAEQSSLDNSLLVIKTTQDISVNKISLTLKKSNLQSKIIDQINDKKYSYHLVELKGFYTDNSKKINSLSGYFDTNTIIKIIGNYPVISN